MTEHARGLMLQGGGALGAFELGAARAIYSDMSSFKPDVIAGVSIGAISAVLLARPAKGLTGLEALELFWQKVTTFDLSGYPFSALFAVPAFYVPELPLWPSSTSLYDTAPLLQTLGALVDTAALADPNAEPRLLMTATDICAGALTWFDSSVTQDTDRTKGHLTLEHVLASGSLPPSFPATKIGGVSYWDGGVFDNTPLGAVIDALDGPDPEIMVINLFPKKVPLPTSMAEVMQTFSNLLFVNKTESDLKLLDRFNAVADLIEALKAVPNLDLEKLKGWDKVKTYKRTRPPIQVTRKSEAKSLEGSDFSAGGIAERAEEGYEATREALIGAKLWA